MMARKSWLLGMLVFIAITLPLTRGFASGPVEGGRRVRMDDERVGPYLLRVVTSPTPPLVDNLYLEVRVKDAASGEVLMDAEVRTLASPEEYDGETLEALATHDYAPIPTEYASHLKIPVAGLWQITIQVDSHLGPAQVSFLERISDPPNLGILIAVGAPLVGLLILVFVFLRLQRKSSPGSGREHPA